VRAKRPLYDGAAQQSSCAKNAAASKRRRHIGIDFDVDLITLIRSRASRQRARHQDFHASKNCDTAHIGAISQQLFDEYGSSVLANLLHEKSERPRMSFRTISFFLLLVSTTPAFANDTVFAAGFDPVWVTGYHVGYQQAMYPTASIDFAAISHIVIGPVVPHSDGTLNTTYDIDATNGPLWANGVAAAAHTANRKATLMVGGAGSIGGWQGAANVTNRAAFVTHLLSSMDSVGADGLDLDWEPLNSDDYASFIALASALRSARPNMILTVPVAWTNPNYQVSDAFYGTIAALFDQINIMS
jgi:hypothetical protein